MDRKPFAVRWRQSREINGARAGRYSVHGFVSGGAGVCVAYPRQAQVTTPHQTLGPRNEVAHLRPQHAVGVPLRAHRFQAEERNGEVAVRGMGLHGIERLQGAQVQQASARDGQRRRARQRIAIEQRGQVLELAELAAQVRGQRDGANIGRSIFQTRVQHDARMARADRSSQDRIDGALQALAARDAPEVEGRGGG